MNINFDAILHQQPYLLLFVTISGAHLYGFPSPDSDYDLRGVHILPLVEIAGLYPTQETIEAETEHHGLEIDLVTHDASKFFGMLLKRNGYVLEQLFSPLIIHSSPAFEALKQIAPQCITRHHAHHYLGFAKTQWGLFEKERPRRVKPLLYVYRVLLTGIHLMQTGIVEANLVHLNDAFRLPYIPELIDRKVSGTEGQIMADGDMAFHAVEYERLVSDMEAARDASGLPESPACKSELNDLLLKIRGLG